MGIIPIIIYIYNYTHNLKIFNDFLSIYFFRFLSTVALCEIWKNTYKTKEIEIRRKKYKEWQKNAFLSYMFN